MTKELDNEGEIFSEFPYWHPVGLSRIQKSKPKAGITIEGNEKDGTIQITDELAKHLNIPQQLQTFPNDNHMTAFLKKYLSMKSELKELSNMRMPIDMSEKEFREKLTRHNQLLERIRGFEERLIEIKCEFMQSRKRKRRVISEW